MKRRLDVIMAILHWMSVQPEPAVEIPDRLKACPDLPEAILRYHVELCEEAGFIRRSPLNSSWWRLTWEGHNKLNESF